MNRVALSVLLVAASGGYVWSQSGAETTAGFALRGDDLQTGSIQPRPPGSPAKAPFSGVHVTPAASHEESDEDEGEDAEESLAPRSSAAPPAKLAGPAPTEEPAPGPSPSTVSLQATAPAIPAPTVPDPAVALPAASRPALVAAAPVMARTPRPRPDYRPPVVSAGMTPVAMNRAQRARYADGTFTGSLADAYYGLVQIQAIVQNGKLIDINVLQYPSDRRTSVRINRQALPMLRDEVVMAQSANVDIISGATLTSEAFIRSIGTALRQAAQ